MTLTTLNYVQRPRQNMPMYIPCKPSQLVKETVCPLRNKNEANISNNSFQKLCHFTQNTVLASRQIYSLTFRHHASYIQDRRTATPHSTLFIYLVNKYIYFF